MADDMTSSGSSVLDSGSVSGGEDIGPVTSGGGYVLDSGASSESTGGTAASSGGSVNSSSDEEDSEPVTSGGGTALDSGSSSRGTGASSGGSTTFIPGGIDSGSVTSSGGSVLNSGSPSESTGDTTASSGGSVNSGSGGTVSGPVTSGGGVVLNSGASFGGRGATDASSGGSADSGSGGVDSGFVTSSGGTVLNSGSASGGTAASSGGSADSGSGGTGSGSVISGGGSAFDSGSGSGSSSGGTGGSGILSGGSAASGSEAPPDVITIGGVSIPFSDFKWQADSGQNSSSTNGGWLYQNPTASNGQPATNGLPDLVAISGAEYMSAHGTFHNVIASGYREGVSGATSASFILASNAGDVINGATALGGAAIAVANGAHLNGGYAGSDASVDAIQGGVASGIVVGSSGAAAASELTSDAEGTKPIGIDKGGTILDAHVLSGGYILAGGGGPGFQIKGFNVGGSRGLISGGTYDDGSMMAVGKGGTALGGTFAGTQYVQSTGSGFGNIFKGSHATQIVGSMGLASGSTALDGALILISGGTGSHLVAGKGGEVFVGGGTYISVLTSDHGTSAGGYSPGKSIGNTVLDGGTEIVGSDGAVTSSVILSGGVELVESGGTSIAANISGGYAEVSSGGYMNGGTAADGGTLIIDSGARGGTLAANSGGYVHIETTSDVNGGISASGGSMDVDGGLLVTQGATAVDGGEIIFGNSGHVQNGAIISNGTIIFGDQGHINDAGTITNGLLAFGSGGSFNNGMHINEGGTVTFGSGGSIEGGIFVSGGTFQMGDYSKNNNGIFVSNGTVQLGNYTSTYDGMTVGSGGTLIMGDNGRAQNSIIASNGGQMVIGENVVLPDDVFVSNGGSLYLTGNDTIKNMRINGGSVYIGSGVVFTGSNYIVSGGTFKDSNNKMVFMQGTVEYASGAYISSSFLQAGRGGVAILDEGGSVASASAYGGNDTNKTPLAGGTIIAHGVIDNADIESGAVLSAGKGAYISGLIMSGGTTYLESGGVLSGGSMTIRGDKSTDYNNPNYHSGLMVVNDGGNLDAATASGGGRLVVNKGGHVGYVEANRRGWVDVNDGGRVDGAYLSLNNEFGGGAGVHIPGEAFVHSGGWLGSASADSGGILHVEDGGTAGTANFQSGTAFVSAGGTLADAVMASGGTAVVGGIVNNLVISNGGFGTLQSGATVGNVLVSAGASASFMSGASALSIIVASGGWASGPVVTDGEELHVLSGGIVSGATITAGQHDLRPNPGGGTDHPTTVDNTGGNAYVVSGGVFDSATIVGASGTDTVGGLLVVEPGAVLTNTSMGYNARIKVDGLRYNGEEGHYELKGNTLYVYEGPNADQVWSLTLHGTYDKDHFVLMDDGYGNTVIVYDKCFLAGSMIRLEDGEVPVENVKAGDRICVYVDGQKQIREVTSVMKRHTTVRSDLPEDMAGWPVQVCKDAFAPNVPSQDLFVTPEHCFYLEGRFVPARMLVNGHSIRYDVSQESYEYYHVQTELHSIIWANNTLTESYLETGARRIFEEEGNISRMVRLRDLTWADDAAAPLDVSRAFVEPLYRHFRARAEVLGYQPEEHHQDLTKDSDLHLALDDGRIIESSGMRNGRVMFRLPAHTKAVRLLSRTFRPSATIGPFVDDRRALGVLVGKVEFWCEGSEIDVTSHLKERDLPGWSVMEAGPHRWTLGDARLPLPALGAPEGGQALLVVHIEAGGPYSLEAEMPDEQPRLSA